MRRLMGFLRAPDGATALEYAVIAMFLSVAIVTGVNAIGDQVLAMFGSITFGPGG